uniref:Uncharacterized protein n=1 Tax=Theileria annulata TaxID=5874 RepID=A0A3B0N3S8_THEAN
MTLNDIYGTYLRSNSVKLKPTRININRIKTTKKYNHDLKVGEINFNANTGYGFRKVVKGFRTIWKAKGHREYANKIVAKSDEIIKKVREVTLYLVNGDVLKLHKQGKKWIQNIITLNINERGKIDETKYNIKMSTTMRDCHNKVTKKIESKRVLIKEFICVNDYGFDKIVETVDLELNQNVIWKKTERSVYAINVALATCSTDEKFMSLGSRRGAYELFYWTKDTGKWERITKNNLNMQTFKFNYDQEKLYKFVEQGLIKYKEKIERFSYMMYFEFPDNFEPKKEYSLAKILEYDIVENTIKITYDNDKTVIHDLKNDKFDLLIKKEQQNIEPQTPLNHTNAVENEKESLATKFNQLNDSTNGSNFHIISDLNNATNYNRINKIDTTGNVNTDIDTIKNESGTSDRQNDNTNNIINTQTDANGIVKLCDNMNHIQNGNKNESYDNVKVKEKVNKLVVLNIDDETPKNEFSFIKRDNYKDYSCYFDFVINKIVENSEKNVLTKVVWSTNNSNEYVNKVSIFEVKNEKFLLIPFKDSKYKMYHKAGKNKSWEDVTNDKIDLTKFKLIDEDGIDIDLTDAITYKDKFTFEISPEEFSYKVKYRNINISTLAIQENGDGKMNEVDVDVLKNEIKFIYTNGEIKPIKINKYFV